MADSGELPNSGLGRTEPIRQQSHKGAAKASEMTGRQIDLTNIVVPSAFRSRRHDDKAAQRRLRFLPKDHNEVAVQRLPDIRHKPSAVRDGVCDAVPMRMVGMAHSPFP